MIYRVNSKKYRRGGFKDFLIVVTHLNQTNLISYLARKSNPDSLLISLLLFTFKEVPLITELKDNPNGDYKLTTLLLVTVWCTCKYLQLSSITYEFLIN